MHLFKSARENYEAKYTKIAGVCACVCRQLILPPWFPALSQLTYHKDLVQRNSPLSFSSESVELKSSLPPAEEQYKILTLTRIRHTKKLTKEEPRREESKKQSLITLTFLFCLLTQGNLYEMQEGKKGGNFRLCCNICVERGGGS